MLDWCGCSRHAGRFGASPPVTRVDRAAPVLPRDGGVPRSCSGIGAAAFVVLLRRYGGTGAELDAIRTASAITVAAGGATALLLAARRQQSTEQTLEHERENAAEQRITELYTRAVDQLGAEKAPVRLARCGPT